MYFSDRSCCRLLIVVKNVHCLFSQGTVEIDDQIEGLKEVAKRTGGLLDLTRVAVLGWSYGGYLSLLCIAKHPEIYKYDVAVVFLNHSMALIFYLQTILQIFNQNTKLLLIYSRTF